MLTVEVRSDEGWGHFMPQQFDRLSAAIRFGHSLNGAPVFRVWRPGPSRGGDRCLYDSRD